MKIQWNSALGEIAFECEHDEFDPRCSDCCYGTFYWDPFPLVHNLVVVGALTATYADGVYRRARESFGRTDGWQPNIAGSTQREAIDALRGDR